MLPARCTRRAVHLRYAKRPGAGHAAPHGNILRETHGMLRLDEKAALVSGAGHGMGMDAYNLPAA